MTDQPSLDSILSGKGAAAPSPDKPQVDEAETLVRETPEGGIATDVVEGQPHKDEAQEPKPDGQDGQPDKTGAGFKGQREGLNKRYTEQVAEFTKKFDDLEQRLEQRFTTLLQTLAAPRQPQQPQAGQPQGGQSGVPDLFAEPEKFVEHLTRTFEQQRAQDRIDFDLRLAAAVHKDDFPKAWEAFLSQVDPNRGGRNPALYAQVMNSPSPGEAIVEWYQREQTLQGAGDLNSLRERLRAEILEEIRTGQPAAPQTNGSAAPPAVMPSNLADARNAGGRTGPAWTGPPSLQDIFKR